MNRARRLLAGLLAAGVLLAPVAGCAQSVDPIERLGRKAAQKVHRPHRAPEPAAGAEPEPSAGVRGDGGRVDPTAVRCGPHRRPPRSGRAPVSSPPSRLRPYRPEPSDGTGAGPGCGRR
ncbi:hypothetical protein [Streptomyces sp. LN785]|uniref:hypothetical protein n=1 Tax=Streptomyces sp. LN785 TaxID=3112983 RepID=UPI0037242289